MAEYYPDIQSFLTIGNDDAFEQICLDTFRYQYKANAVYQKFCNLLGTPVEDKLSLGQIPFLPVEIFRSHRVQCGTSAAEKIFTSSGTTGQATSKHFIKDLAVYDNSLLRGFEMFYGPASDYCILALLPSYLEREGSSLVYMVQKLMELSGHKENGFYLYDHNRLAETIKKLITTRQKTLLIGVSFALLDFSQQFPIPLPEDFIVMETGGMKGRRKEMVREELHETLQAVSNSGHPFRIWDDRIALAGLVKRQRIV
jgi:phenylacetate-coenzyme A ligase PaaK-like adenylate-forming protein